jgi:endonuclease YncB( thermonuclease family)
VQTVARSPQKAPQTGAFLLSRPINWAAALRLLFLVSLLPLSVMAARTEGARVAEVLDGDTVRLVDGRHLRLIGINAPELGHDGWPDEPFATAARDRLNSLVLGREIRLVFEEQEHDHYGRSLAHVELTDGTQVEEDLLREGLGSAIAIPPNVRDIARLQAAETLARQAHRGLWGDSYYLSVPAETLDLAHTGYRFVHGRVTHVGSSHKYVYLDIGPRLALRIAHEDWTRYFRDQPQNWRGARVEARGWITEYQGRLHMNVGHPAMLRRLP